MRAEWRGSEGLALTNIAGSEGENITIGVTGSDKISAILTSACTYAGTYAIAATGEEGISNAFTSKTQTLNAGNSFILSVTRGSNPAQNVTIAAGSDTPEGIVAAINGATATTNVKATLVEDFAGYRIALNNANGTLTDFTINTTVAAYTQVDSKGNTNVDADLGFQDHNNTRLGLNKPTEISLTLASTGIPADLGRLGFATEVMIDGPAADDYAIFLTGTGTVDALLGADKATTNTAASYPADSFEIAFTSASVYTIKDLATGTVLPPEPTPQVRTSALSGVRVVFDDIPASGDKYTVEPNTDGIGNNENMLALIELAKEPMIAVARLSPQPTEI